MTLSQYAKPLLALWQRLLAAASISRHTLRRGASIGPEFTYRWRDAEPSDTTWAQLAEKREASGMLAGFVGVLMICSTLWGRDGLILGFLFLSYPGAVICGLIARGLGRSDHEPVPEWVDRSAGIEIRDGQYFFVLECRGKPEIYQPWEKVERFEVADYWSMFGDAGASPYKTGWHAIIMTPQVGRPWLIGSTIEGKATVREKFTILDAKFGPAARAKFMREQMQPKPAAAPASSSNDTDDDGVPQTV